GSRGAARASHAERVPERGDKAVGRQLPVPQLAPLVLGDGPKPCSGALDDAALLLVRQRRRGFEVERRLDARLGLLRLLAARAARTRRAVADLGSGDGDAPRDPDPVRTRLAGDGVNCALRGCCVVRVGVDLIEIDRVRRALARYAD